MAEAWEPLRTRTEGEGLENGLGKTIHGRLCVPVFQWFEVLPGGVAVVDVMEIASRKQTVPAAAEEAIAMISLFEAWSV